MKLVIYYIIRFNSLRIIFTHMSFLAEVFGVMCTIFNVGGPDGTSCDEVRFRSWWLGLPKMLVWLACVIMSKNYEFCNAIDHLVRWLGVVYNICLTQIFRWCLIWSLLVVYVKFLGLLQCWYMWIYMFSISCFERSTCLANIEFGTVVKFEFIYSYPCVFSCLVLCVVLLARCIWRVVIVVNATLYSSFLKLLAIFLCGSVVMG